MLVLYVEDDLDDFSFFCEVIQSFDSSIECIHASNGIDAIDFLENSNRLPDYVVIDINMPAMDGKACLKNIKKNPALMSIPVIMYSTSKHPKDIELCMELGAVDYLMKPNTMEEAVRGLSKYFTPQANQK